MSRQPVLIFLCGTILLVFYFVVFFFIIFSTDLFIILHGTLSSQSKNCFMLIIQSFLLLIPKDSNINKYPIILTGNHGHIFYKNCGDNIFSVNNKKERRKKLILYGVVQRRHEER